MRIKQKSSANTSRTREGDGNEGDVEDNGNRQRYGNIPPRPPSTIVARRRKNENATRTNSRRPAVPRGGAPGRSRKKTDTLNTNVVKAPTKQSRGRSSNVQRQGSTISNSTVTRVPQGRTSPCSSSGTGTSDRSSDLSYSSSDRSSFSSISSLSHYSLTSSSDPGKCVQKQTKRVSPPDESTNRSSHWLFGRNRPSKNPVDGSSSRSGSSSSSGPILF